MNRAAVFDVDGTLADTNHLHVVTWWEAFRQAGHRVPMHAVHRAVGLGAEDLVEHLLDPGRDRGGDAAISAAHKTLYGTYADRLPAFPEAGRLLRTLAGRGGPSSWPRPPGAPNSPRCAAPSTRTTPSPPSPVPATPSTASPPRTRCGTRWNWPARRPTGPCSSGTPSGTWRPGAAPE